MLLRRTYMKSGLISKIIKLCIIVLLPLLAGVLTGIYAYGNYQDRLKIINEYLGNIKLRDFRKDRINDFENYLNNERKWNYTFKPSNITINEIMNVLNQLLKAAIRWNLLDKDYNCIVKEKISEDERINLKKLQDQINDFQKIRITNSLDKIWNRKK